MLKNNLYVYTQNERLEVAIISHIYTKDTHPPMLEAIQSHPWAMESAHILKNGIPAS